MVTVYYVVGFDSDVRHAVTHDPWQWVRTTPELPMRTLCGIGLVVALPGSGRERPRCPLPDGQNPFCSACTWCDLVLPGPVRQVITTTRAQWLQHAPDRRSFGHRR